MKRITQDAHFRQRMMLYLEHHGVEETANQYHVTRKTVWKWRKRWDGTSASLEEESRRPKRSPQKQKPWEIKLVRRMRKKYGQDLLLGYQKACQYGYTRSYGCFKRTAVREIPPKKKARKRQNKPYQRAEYPGQKVQIDVKYVPSWCVADGNKYYQYTAKDECTRWTYREMYAEHSTDSSKQFLISLVLHAPFPIREVQTDNGTEFTKRLIANDPNDKTSFELELEHLGIIHHLIRPATPRHNGKVERQHRIDEMRFYRHMRMYSLEDGRKQLAKYQKVSNDNIMTCLGMRSPNQLLALYQGVL
jgi:transposase InsO family protein